MKSYKFKSVLMLSALLGLSACSENSWNDELDGFDVPPVAAGVTNITYELTAADYKAVASLAGSDYESVGANGCFASEEEARELLPAFLSSQTDFPYFDLNNGSGVKISYKVAGQVPGEIQFLNSGISQLKVSEADYQSAWGSDDDYIASFAPACPASEKLPAILSAHYADAADGDYVYVSYSEANVNPVFGNVSGEVPSWEMTSVIAGAKEGDALDIRGVISAVCTRGFVVTDASGASLLCYQSDGFDINSVSVGANVNVSGQVGSFNNGLQIAITPADYSVVSEGSYAYPAPMEITAANAASLANPSAKFNPVYVSLDATVKVGDYTNFIIDGLKDPQGSPYQMPSYFKDKLVDGAKVKLNGYLVSVSGKGTKYLNIMITAINGVSKAPRLKLRKAPAAEVVGEGKAAVYQKSGKTWKRPSDTLVLQASDYAAMDQKYGNLSGTLDSTLLPIYLKGAAPYAAEGDVRTVVYLYYDSAAKSTDVKARQFVLANGEWIPDPYMDEAVDQFVRSDNKWVYNPSVVLTLPYERNTDPSFTYYMACVNWVYENICVPMGDTSLTSGKFFIDYRGNAEFYSGASAYYGNVDVRASSALNNMPEGYKGYEGLSDDQIVLLLKKRFSTEVMKGALSILHADAAPVEGMDVTYTITFTAYDGAAKEETVVYKVVGKGQFEYVSSTWVTPEESADWK